MPGRVGRRSAATSEETTSRRTATRTRRTAAALAPRDEGPETLLRKQIAKFFSDAQHGEETHKKLVSGMRNVQEAVCYESGHVNPKYKQFGDFSEEDFNEEVKRCVYRLLEIKKSEKAGDRIRAFLVEFLKTAIQKDYEALAGAQAEEVLDSPSTRLKSEIQNILLDSMGSKDKIVRFRATETLARLITDIEDELIEDDYYKCRRALMRRLEDKEASIRVQAAIGFGTLATRYEDQDGSDAEDDDRAGGLFRLLTVMQQDPSAEVRRAILLNLPLDDPRTRPYMIERARDSDVTMRRLVYKRLLPALGDFRQLKMAERDKVIRWGLRDRDVGVQQATARLLCEHWIRVCEQTEPGETGVAVESENRGLLKRAALIEFCKQIRILRTGLEGGMAHDAMKALWAGRPDYLHDITFRDQEFWNDLTLEKVFVMRTFTDYCSNSEDEAVQDLRDTKMPELTAVGSVLQKWLQALVEESRRTSKMPEVDEQTLKELDALEFLVVQLLHIVLGLDLNDRVGGKQIYHLIQGPLERWDIADSCTELMVDILHRVCDSRKDFIDIIKKSIEEVRDSVNDIHDEKVGDNDVVMSDHDDESFHSAQSEASDDTAIPSSPRAQQPPEMKDNVQELLARMKCLHLVGCMMKHVSLKVLKEPKTRDFVFETLKGDILNDLVAPSMSRKLPSVRASALPCLAHFGFLQKNLAESNMVVMAHAFDKGDVDLQIAAIRALTDWAAVYRDLFANNPQKADPNNKWLLPEDVYLQGFASEEPEIRFEACKAAFKLLLPYHSPFDEEFTQQILFEFVIGYFNPQNANDTGLRQALVYGLSSYCHSRTERALLFSRLVPTVVRKLVQLIENELDDDEKEDMTPWPKVTEILASWTDARLVYGKRDTALGAAEDPHTNLAALILERVRKSTCTGVELKVLMSLLTKLYISPAPPQSAAGEVFPDAGEDRELLETLYELVTEAVEEGMAPDAVSRNYLKRLETGLKKRLVEVEGAVEEVTKGVTSIKVEDQTEQAEEDEEQEKTVAQSGRRSAEATTTAEGEGEVTTTTVEAEDEEDEEKREKEDEEEEDTFIAGMQGESTRMPLFEEDEAEDDDTVRDLSRASRRTPRRAASRRHTAVTESDIIDELLESELEE
ncbi:uncharacterized protein EI97DRAFT_467200 [Westerdykella ornata]|uniref:Nuclear condensin complex subunit 3 C-terminal domain-containing protein n=1 Tax=Westerdykella ornata TaxID=318751 RepID=A0A6A6JJ74_WESOR|nr:uncharacterized protein EI97DRAFT_467200 [Westerdykella ornata]KAF2276527.1 hypothetical protein EI97DRAFT_467200 [Westerdykella ornata]